MWLGIIYAVMRLGVFNHEIHYSLIHKKNNKMTLLFIWKIVFFYQ